MNTVKIAYNEAWNIDASKYTQSAVKKFALLFKTMHFKNMYEMNIFN